MKNIKAKGLKLGFVPTMGALHEGHISLVERAKEQCGAVLVSIFVNPTQFNDKEDFARYPVSTEDDIRLLKTVSCDAVFIPDKKEIYPNGPESAPVYDFGRLDKIFEGAFRPGHFSGVGQVVARLLDIVEPDVLFLGQKDYQQCLVIKRLIQLLGKSEIELVICPTVREADGLAMSSRNRRLTEPQRAVAGAIYQCLVSVQTKKNYSGFQLVKKECIDLLASKGIETEYFSLANAENLEMMDDFDNTVQMIILVAVKIGDIRLIDNMLLNK